MSTLLDLFCGCGGITLGSHRAGFKTALAVDIDPILTSSFKKNFPNTRLLLKDIAELTKSELEDLIPEGVDGIVGGPPCQAFSGMGRGIEDDPRRDLLAQYFRIVSILEPKFFLMENVPGLLFEKNIHVLRSAIDSLHPKWKVLEPVILDAADYGAPTKRKRVFVVGFNTEKLIAPDLESITRSNGRKTTVKDAIEDLLYTSRPNKEEDVWKHNKIEGISQYATEMRSSCLTFSGHHLTTHRPETISRYASVPAGGVDPVGKHKRLSWNGLCPTLRAGTGNDRGSYQSVRPLHPELNRVITPREAARLQGFPDSFYFHTTVWHSFRMIGNSVSPIIAEAVLKNISNHLRSCNLDFKSHLQKQLLNAEPA